MGKGDVPQEEDGATSHRVVFRARPGYEGRRSPPVLNSALDVAQVAVVWLGGAVAAGVAGNAAYDALKGILRRLRRAEPDESATIGHADAVALAHMAVVERFDALGLRPVLDGDITGVEARQRDSGRWWVYLSGPQVSINVDIDGYQPHHQAVRTTVSLLRHPAIDEARRTEKEAEKALRAAVLAEFENGNRTTGPTLGPSDRA